MEKDLQIGVILERKENIYYPKETVVGFFDEEKLKFISSDKEYSIITSKDEKIVSFIFDINQLMKLYNLSFEEFSKKYFEDIKNYLIIENEDDIKYFYKGENPIVLEPNEFANHFINVFINKAQDEYFDINTSKELCANLYNKVFMQPEAIKKLVVGISTHYMDTEGIKKSNIIIDGKKGSFQNEIVSVLKDTLPCEVHYEDLSNENFDFDALFFKLSNSNSELNSTLILDNAESLLFNPNSYISSSSENTLRDLMMGIDYKIMTDSGIVNYPTKDLLIIIMGDFSKKVKSGYNSYFDGVPEKLSNLTNYNIKLKPMDKDMILLKLCHPENGLIPYYMNFFADYGINLTVSNTFIEEICNKVLNEKNANLDKIVSTAFEEAIFELLTSDDKFTNLHVNKRVLTNNKNYKLR